jgi:hypothetical protein
MSLNFATTRERLKAYAELYSGMVAARRQLPGFV